MPVARYSACEIALGQIQAEPLAAVCEVAPVAALVLVFPVDTYRCYSVTTTVLLCAVYRCNGAGEYVQTNVMFLPEARRVLRVVPTVSLHVG